QSKQEARRGNLSGVSVAVSTDYHDDDGGVARRTSPRDRGRYGRRASPAARHLDRRRSHFFADADALHDTRGLPLPRSLSALVAASPPGASAFHEAGSGESFMKRLASLLATVLLGVTGCAVGPDYKRPVAPMSPAFKEQTGEVSVAASDWKPAE